jgi:hypothetical protein
MAAPYPTSYVPQIVAMGIGELQKLSPTFAETRPYKDHILPAYCGLFNTFFYVRQNG